MPAWLDRLRRRLDPDLSALPLQVPERDEALARRMAGVAVEFAARYGADFTVDGLSKIRTSGASVVDVGAYVGGVIVRSSPRASWARNGRGDPGVAVGAWLADPFEWVAEARSAGRSGPIEERAAFVLAFAEDPGVDHESAGTGAVLQQHSPWDDVRAAWRRRRRRP